MRSYRLAADQNEAAAQFNLGAEWRKMGTTSTLSNGTSLLPARDFLWPASLSGRCFLSGSALS